MNEPEVYKDFYDPKEQIEESHYGAYFEGVKFGLFYDGGDLTFEEAKQKAIELLCERMERHSDEIGKLQQCTSYEDYKEKFQ